ncbi:CHAT domain-containing protein [Streptomyces profundus]|uniref:CHAT domain-containing protein n=1 Tax=Streptomyces profundus TaxID=2867410 RepID=UPI001D16307F|nr:CHAT domain-containing protein [Streptomyces sp. MA3_2.13]UED87581.1 CHAT domain-containing protein [Streptomyces sp. MA3_2.13]
MAWLRGLAVAGGTGLVAWGWWLDQRPATRFELYRDPDGGALSTVTTPGHVLPIHSLAVVGLLLLIVAVLKQRRADIRRGLAAWRERPAAVHISGFPHVIGTLWDIVSSDGPAVADDFYGYLQTEGHTPAEALHQAQRRLRAAAPGDPARWAPFVHIGP